MRSGFLVRGAWRPVAMGHGVGANRDPDSDIVLGVAMAARAWASGVGVRACVGVASRLHRFLDSRGRA